MSLNQGSHSILNKPLHFVRCRRAVFPPSLAFELGFGWRSREWVLALANYRSRSRPPRAERLSMKLRGIVLAVAGFGIPLALVVLVLPITWGYGGYLYGSQNRVSYVDPAGPAARAGLREGDRFETLHGLENVAQFGGPVGTTVHLKVTRGAAVVPVNLHFEAFAGPLADQERFNKILIALTALGAFVVAILVVLRARDVRVGARASAVLVASGLEALFSGVALVAGNDVLATLGYYALPMLFMGVTFWAALSLLAVFPPRRTRIRTLCDIAGPCVFTVFGLFFALRVFAIWTGTPYSFYGGYEGWAIVISGIAIGIAIVDAIASAPAEVAIATRWLGGCWIVAMLVTVMSSAANLLHVSPLVNSHYGDILRAAEVFFLAFGVGYPVLRHRLVDLNILVTRATAFGVVSLIIVGIFVAAEWAISRIFEQEMGVANASGVGPQGATLAIVLILGVSARSIHQFVETRLTRVFFRKRLKGIAEIRRVAREADASTEARAIMDLGCATVRQSLDPLSVVCYIREGDAYVVAGSSGNGMASAYQFNDAAPLRLRRWQEPFEIDDDSDARFHMLYLPMTLRGELLGFLCCGPKPDRTPYLSDEIEALSLLAHHLGIAAALLSRTPLTPPSLSVVAT